MPAKKGKKQIKVNHTEETIEGEGYTTGVDWANEPDKTVVEPPKPEPPKKPQQIIVIIR